MSPRLTSTKFLLTLLIQVTGCIALFMKLIDGGTYVALSTLTLSSYGAASVADKKLNPTQQP
jgi:hypothetical protein